MYAHSLVDGPDNCHTYQIVHTVYRSRGFDNDKDYTGRCLCGAEGVGFAAPKSLGHNLGHILAGIKHKPDFLFRSQVLSQLQQEPNILSIFESAMAGAIDCIMWGISSMRTAPPRQRRLHFFAALWFLLAFNIIDRVGVDECTAATALTGICYYSRLTHILTIK